MFLTSRSSIRNPLIFWLSKYAAFGKLVTILPENKSKINLIFSAFLLELQRKTLYTKVDYLGLGLSVLGVLLLTNDSFSGWFNLFSKRLSPFANPRSSSLVISVCTHEHNNSFLVDLRFCRPASDSPKCKGQRQRFAHMGWMMEGSVLLLH